MENGSRKEVIAPAAAATTAASPSYRDIFPIRLDFLFKAFQPLARLLAKFLILTQVAHIGCDTKLHSSNRTYSCQATDKISLPNLLTGRMCWPCCFLSALLENPAWLQKTYWAKLTPLSSGPIFWVNPFSWTCFNRFPHLHGHMHPQRVKKISLTLPRQKM